MCTFKRSAVTACSTAQEGGRQQVCGMLYNYLPVIYCNQIVLCLNRRLLSLDVYNCKS